MDIRKVTWLAHNDARIEWEKSINITKRSKHSAHRASSRRPTARPRLSRTHTTRSSTIGNNYAFDPSMWLIWALSNFLHSGSWSEHRSTTLHHSDFIDFKTFISFLNLDLSIHPIYSSLSIPYFFNT
ncbi:hypothetical protein C1645_840489 [Glomus cerebriforme]|uniref:Uncharacterized protein n=1 Tax=Glomus cerebriforme TaxID=658196 RepID=A0A397S0T1_9GLOM|nr:hypothetical protein C1645_840489 [Glomus cerebriforme]